uniref:RNA-directed DNA polymerase, eukaryota, reverse transcriptase zinc-binding domain protein n=1 Tax=Lactuca sativa TaxID=4236 RepID=A0A9R1WHJ8_LACSA|nr:hypothetical protein LSAT_V11C100042220 [Lactuca sativa]
MKFLKEHIHLWKSSYLSGTHVKKMSYRKRVILQQLKEIEKIKITNVAQKEKVKWGIEADENTKFFHGVINKKRSQLAISGIKEEGESLIVLSLTEEVKIFKLLNGTHKEALEVMVLEKEECGSAKSPDSDGFSFGFYKKYWDLNGTDVMEIVEELFIAGKILSGCNSSFITLILMVDSPIMVTNFRLISLIGARSSNSRWASYG